MHVRSPLPLSIPQHHQAHHEHPRRDRLGHGGDRVSGRPVLSARSETDRNIAGRIDPDHNRPSTPVLIRVQKEKYMNIETTNQNVKPGRFRVIYADPPWDIAQKGARGAVAHYDLMTLDRIKGMPVGELAADNATLLLLSLIHI